MKRSAVVLIEQIRNEAQDIGSLFERSESSLPWQYVVKHSCLGARIARIRLRSPTGLSVRDQYLINHMNYAITGTYISRKNASCRKRGVGNGEVSIDSNRLSRDSCASKGFRVECFYRRSKSYTLSKTSPAKT